MIQVFSQKGQSNGIRRTTLFLLLVSLFLFLFQLAYAEPLLPVVAVEQDIQQDLERASQLRFSPRPLRYRAQDFDTLEFLSDNEASGIYEVLPNPTFRTLRTTNVNLYRRDMALFDKFRLDLRLSSKISLETRTQLIDVLLILSPLERRMSLALSRQLSENTLASAFFDPISHEILGILSHQLTASTELGMLYYHNPAQPKHDIIGSIKFYF